jgi:hypothetical protein
LKRVAEPYFSDSSQKLGTDLGSTYSVTISQKFLPGSVHETYRLF